MIKPAVLVLASLAMVAPSLVSADEIDDAIDARRGFFQLVKHNAGVLFGMAKGAVAYDAAVASAAATNLEKLSKLDNDRLWPQGSSNVDRPGKTRTLPEAWTTFPAILEKDQAFKDAAAIMAANAGGGFDALRANIQTLGNSCSGCHDNYRAKSF